MADDDGLDSFERAFTNGGGCVRDCACGRVFYNPDGGWTWEDGELDRLRADPTATALEWSVGEMVIEGKSYVPDCDCWKPIALKFIAFIRRYDEEIAEFLTNEKRRKQAEADRSPVVRYTNDHEVTTADGS